ncbi:hypothetical protein KJ632_03020 [Patescibacteria group bacterium]|nr:hypothetical protein [Patescibacteria group bacterium]
MISVLLTMQAMKFINFLRSKKKILLIVGIIIFAGIVGLYSYLPKFPTYEISIDPTGLLPFASHEQARANVCDAMKGQLFDEICQGKFDIVGKSDTKKINELFLFIKKIGDDREISDYEKLLLSQAAFASLPTKNSPLAQQSIFSSLLTFISKKNTAYASDDNFGMGRESFIQMMSEDLRKVVGDIPKGDNAWVINIMVSRYEWINGERQPIYSEKYGEIFDPYPGVFIEDKHGWEQRDLVHVSSRVGAYSSNKNTITIIEEGVGERIVYSFSIMSWHSKPYGTDSKLVLAEAGPSERYSTSSHNFTEEEYEGDDLLFDLLKVVEMPSMEQSDEEQDKPVPPPGTPLTYSEARFIGGTPGCEGWVDDPSSGLYCFDSFAQIEELTNKNVESDDEFKIGVLDLIENMEPTYPYTDVEEREKKWAECIEQHPGEDSYLCEGI